MMCQTRCEVRSVWPCRSCFSSAACASQQKAREQIQTMQREALDRGQGRPGLGRAQAAAGGREAGRRVGAGTGPADQPDAHGPGRDLRPGVQGREARGGLHERGAGRHAGRQAPRGDGHPPGPQGAGARPQEGGRRRQLGPTARPRSRRQGDERDRRRAVGAAGPGRGARRGRERGGEAESRGRAGARRRRGGELASALAPSGARGRPPASRRRPPRAASPPRPAGAEPPARSEPPRRGAAAALASAHREPASAARASQRRASRPAPPRRPRSRRRRTVASSSSVAPPPAPRAATRPIPRGAIDPVVLPDPPRDAAREGGGRHLRGASRPRASPRSCSTTGRPAPRLHPGGDAALGPRAGTGA